METTAHVAVRNIEDALYKLENDLLILVEVISQIPPTAKQSEPLLSIIEDRKHLLHALVENLK